MAECAALDYRDFLCRRSDSRALVQSFDVIFVSKIMKDRLNLNENAVLEGKFDTTTTAAFTRMCDNG